MLAISVIASIVTVRSRIRTYFVDSSNSRLDLFYDRVFTMSRNSFQGSSPFQDSTETSKKIRPKPSTTDFIYPTDDQAFVFDRSEQYTLQDYLDALIEDGFLPLDIVSATTIDDKRVVVYLRNKLTFSFFIFEGASFRMKDGTFIKCRPFNEPSTKLVISNIPPSVPNDVLLNFITNVLKLRTISEVAILPVNSKNQLFAHVVSWKRQVYIDEDTITEHFVDNVPYMLPYDKKLYRVGFAIRKILCSNCETNDHRDENCFFSPMPKIL